MKAVLTDLQYCETGGFNNQVLVVECFCILLFYFLLSVAAVVWCHEEVFTKK